MKFNNFSSFSMWDLCWSHLSSAPHLQLELCLLCQGLQFTVIFNQPFCPTCLNQRPTKKGKSKLYKLKDYCEKFFFHFSLKSSTMLIITYAHCQGWTSRQTIHYGDLTGLRLSLVDQRKNWGPQPSHLLLTTTFCHDILKYIKEKNHVHFTQWRTLTYSIITMFHISAMQ